MNGYPIIFTIDRKPYVAEAAGSSGATDATLRLTPDLRSRSTTQVVVAVVP